MYCGIIDKTNYTSFKYKEVIHDQIISICSPLTEGLSIPGFGYKQIYPDGRYFSWSRCLQWEQIQSQHVHHNSLSWEGGVQLSAKDNDTSPVPLLWPSQPNSDLTQLIHDQNGLTGISFAKYSPVVTEFWEFAGSNNNDFLRDFFTKKHDILQHFIQYFNVKASHIINVKDQEYEKFSVYRDGVEYPETSPYIAQVDPKHIALFLKEIESDTLARVLLGSARLSRREFECLRGLSQGGTCKQIANHLQLSPRTVEVYIAKIREKTGLFYRSDLVKFYQGVYSVE